MNILNRKRLLPLGLISLLLISAPVSAQRNDTETTVVVTGVVTNAALGTVWPVSRYRLTTMPFTLP